MKEVVEIGIGKVVTYQSSRKRLSIHSVLQSDNKILRLKNLNQFLGLAREGRESSY